MAPPTGAHPTLRPVTGPRAVAAPPGVGFGMETPVPATRPLLTCGRLRNPVDRTRPANEFTGGFLAAHEVRDTDPVVFLPDIPQPMANVASHHERIGGRVAIWFL